MFFPWTPECWNILHIVSPLVSEEDRPFFLEWLELLSFLENGKAIQWLSTHKQECLSKSMDLIIYQLRKEIDTKCPSKTFITSYYKKEHITRDVWGPYLWPFLHRLSITLPAISFQNLFTLFLKWITCPVCKIHGTAYKEEHPFTDQMDSWMILFHNNVSERLNETNGTKKKIYSIQEGLSVYR